jgi:uncharacterized protein YegL
MNKTNGTEPTPAPLTAVIVLDESGSMGHLRTTVVEGFKVFCDELREEPGEVRLSLTSFNTSFDHRYVAVPLAEVTNLRKREYNPGGMTALFDAVAHAAIETEKRLTAEGRADERVLVAVITDGHENSSTDYDAASLALLLERFEERGNWTCVYLGAAHADFDDATDYAAGLGFKPGNAMYWLADARSAQATFRSLSHATKTRRRHVRTQSEEFFGDALQLPSDYTGRKT